MADHSFPCASCRQEAGRVQLYHSGELIRHSFTSRATCTISPAAIEKVAAAISAGDIKALYEYDIEIVSFYCPACDACYCRDHWFSWDVFEKDDDGIVWHDSIRGRCPRGHERMLED